MDRTILHCDCNGFYASVECVARPELKNVPMAVCGDPESRHGIILAKNELAKRQGIVTAETVWQAVRKCPELVLVGPHHSEYARYSRLVNEIYARYTDQVEPFGIDESWLDVTGSLHLFGDGVQIADRIRRQVREELGLTVSVGVSYNKIFAKLGSDYKKPDATTLISRENYRRIVFPLPVSDLLFVGKKAAEQLNNYGVRTIGELAGCSQEILTRMFGKMGASLWEYANGLDDSPVRPAGEERNVKSVGNGMTFRRDLTGPEDIRAGVVLLADSVAMRLRRYGYRCQTVQVMIKNPTFKTISRQKTLGRATCLARDISRAVLELIGDSWNPSAPIRSLTITGTNLVMGDYQEQLSLFSSGEQAGRARYEKLEKTMDAIREKYGKSSLSFAVMLHNDILSGSGEDGDEDSP